MIKKEKVAPCGNPKCTASSGICDRPTFGHGLLSTMGYWEHPCFVCARDWEIRFKEQAWPHKGENKEPLKNEIEKRKCPKCQQLKSFFKKDTHTDYCNDCWVEGHEPDIYPDLFDD